MSCVLRLTGKDFDVDGFLGETQLLPYKVFRIGEKISKNGKEYYENGCYFDLSNASFDDLIQQQNDAIRFLTENFIKLKLVSNYHLSVLDRPTIDFAINTRIIRPYVAVQCDHFPYELLQLSGELGFGIELSQYIPSDDEEELK